MLLPVEAKDLAVLEVAITRFTLSGTGVVVAR
jgi:hypothetical protein